MNPKALFLAGALMGGGVSTATLTAIGSVNAQAGADRVVVTNEYPSDNAVIQQIKTRVFDAQCGTAETQASMQPGSCKVTPGTSTCINWGDDTDPDSMTTVDTRFLFTLQRVWDADQP